MRWTIGWLVALGGAIWAVAAVYHDFPAMNVFADEGFAAAIVAALIFMRGMRRKLFATFFGCGLVLAWWLTLKSSNDRIWHSDVARASWAAVNGDSVTLHNVRNCDYRTDADYTRTGRRGRCDCRN